MGSHSTTHTPYEDSKNFGGGEKYWNERYIATEHFEWLGESLLEQLPSLIRETIGEPDACGELLHVGCGNSKLPEALHTAGYTAITNIDMSGEVVAQMSNKYEHLSGM